MNRYGTNSSIVDLLVSYKWGNYLRAKREITYVLERFGDPLPRVGKTFVMGIAIVNTCLDNREVIRRCHALWANEPLDSFESAIKWVPVDYWCTTALDAIKQVIDNRIAPRIEHNQTWAMKVYKRRWEQHHTSEIIEFLAAGIERRVDLDHPDWIVWVDVVGRETAVSLLQPQDIFSIGIPEPSADTEHRDLPRQTRKGYSSDQTADE